MSDGRLLSDGEEEEQVGFATALQNLLWAEAKRRGGIPADEHPHSVNALRPDSPAARRLHLRHLEVAAECGKVAEQVMEDAAARAGRAGASYPEMGAAAGITRQAARNRWPQAVGTRWYLHTLTGRQHPHGAGTATTRSRDKAVATGWDAVRKGDAATGGAVAAVVCDSERRVVWACFFDPAEYDAVTIKVPDDLIDVPADGDEDHQAWTDQWAQFVDAEIERRTVRA
ncbi:hypothetical protein ACFWFI_25005 [Streptomyces sp. NPDC060209]|uniref:hypothetical protein n=1 Tax=Streptomyces sp. NPDC060209 TaxID=3347073 RepID=UPI003656BCCB